MENQLKVLLIEDNDGDAFLMKFYLEDSVTYKFDIVHAKTMEGAFEKMTGSKFDIILMDLNLPDSDGVESIRKFIEKFPGSLVVVLTGLIDEKVGFEAVKYGAQDFLVKGKFDSKLLISSVVFSYERFNLNKKLAKVSSELNDGQTRFENLQKLANIGYYEYNFITKKLFVSQHVAETLGLGESKDIPLDEALTQFINHNSYESILAQVNSGITEGEGEYDNKLLQRTIHFKWKMIDGVFTAVAFY